MFYSFGRRFVLGLSLGLAFSVYVHADEGTNLSRFIGDTRFTQNVFDLTARAGLKGAPANQPWSGSYWPLHSGSIANPYFESKNAWANYYSRMLIGVKQNEKHYENRMADIRSKINALDADTINEMSPAEKYDLYLGDRDFSLTTATWQSLMEQKKRVGNVALWEGSCQGWTTAASFSPRPEHPIQVMSLDGRYLIPFYPDDIKALATLLWANSLVQDHTVFQGMRCQSAHPNYDQNTGHVNDVTCKGVEPGDFHTSVMEIVGARKNTFIINRENNQQVWNQPIAGYEVTYFNPISDKDKPLAEAVVPRAAYADPYAQYRNAAAVSIVGVNMKLKYVAETLPDHRQSDDPSKDKIKELDLRYDLELDANNQIVGGEWRNSSDPEVHTASTNDDDSASDDDTPDSASIPTYPGFIWKFSLATPTAFSIADTDLDGDDVTQLDEATVIQASKKASQFRYNHYKYDANGNATLDHAELKPQPLEKVVKALVAQSRS